MREDWVEVEFNDVLEIVSGKNQKQVISVDGKYPIYGSGGIIGRAKEYLCEEGTTIIGRKGTINSPIFVKERFWNVDTAFGLSPFPTLQKRLLFFFTIYFNFKKLDKSTTIPSLAKRDLLKINFPLPPIPEQRAIVAKIETLFSDLDKGIEDLNKAKDQLVIYRQAVLKKAFEGEYSEDANIELNRIGEYCKIVSGKAFKKSEYSNSGVRLFQIANVSFNKIVWDKIAHLPKSYLSDEKFKDLVLKEGDLVMALNRPMLNNELKIGILGKSDVPSILYQRVGKFVFDSKINSKYLGYFFQSPVFIKWLSKELQGVNIPFINQSNLLGFSEFPYVGIELQLQIVQEIESRLSVCDKVEQSISESLEKAKALRQSILKKAFEGKLLTKEEIEKCKAEKDYEPASVLLERIKKENVVIKTITKLKRS